jgi:hypothetical protein
MMLGVNLREAFNSEIRLKFEFEPSYYKSVVFLHRSEALHSNGSDTLLPPRTIG